MRKVATTALAALLAISLVVPASIAPAQAANGNKRALAAGLLLGIAAAAVVSNSNSARASSSTRQQRNWAAHCRNLYKRCVNGSNRACDKYETGGCTE